MGYIVPEDNYVDLYDMPKLRRLMAFNIRQIMLKRTSWQIQAAHLHVILCTLFFKEVDFSYLI